MNTTILELQQKQAKQKQLVDQLKESLHIQNIDPNIFDKGSFTLQSVSADRQYVNKSKRRHVLLDDGTCIVRVEKIYKDGTKENFPLEKYAQLKNGKLKGSK